MHCRSRSHLSGRERAQWPLHHTLFSVARSLYSVRSPALSDVSILSSKFWPAASLQEQIDLQHAAQDQNQQGPKAAHAACQQQHMTQQQELQKALRLDACRLDVLVAKAPFLLGFEPETLAVTLDALGEALYTDHRVVVSIIEKRPEILLAPYEPAQVLQQVATVLGTTSRHAGVSLSKHMQLLALTPQQLQQRLQQLSSTMHWPPNSPQQAAAAAGTPAFLQLLSANPAETARQLTALAQALGVSEAACAAVAQHHPRQLLQVGQPGNALLPQLRVLTAAAGVTASELLEELDAEQSKGLAGLLLYEASWIKQQLRSLSLMLEGLLGHKLPGRVLVWLLLRLGTPNMFSSLHRLSETRARVAVLQQIAVRHKQWEEELHQATDRELSVLLCAGSAELQRALFLASTGKAGGCGLTLQEVACWPWEDFTGQYGRDEIEQWSEQGKLVN